MPDPPRELNSAALQAAFPEYEIAGEPLGRGGMKDAFLATSNGEPLVIKVIREPVADDAQEGGLTLPERVRREVDGMKRVDHPGVVPIVRGPDIREIDGAQRVWYGEPYYPGGTLEGRLGEPWAATDALDLAWRLTEAAEALASAGVVHRDIKPGNIVYSSSGDPVLLDLGIAYFIDLTPITDAWGRSPRTPRYAAPEQFEVRRLARIDFRTDLFLIGVVAFEALTGVHPFRPDEPDEYFQRLTGGHFDAAALDAVDPSPPIRRLLSRLLAGSVSGRFRKFKFVYDEIAGCR